MILEHNGRRVVLDLYRAKDGQMRKETWLLTGFVGGLRVETDVPVNLKKIKEPLFFKERTIK